MKFWGDLLDQVEIFLEDLAFLLMMDGGCRFEFYWIFFRDEKLESFCKMEIVSFC